MYGFSFDEILGKYEAGELSWADVPYPLRPAIENSISTRSTVSSVLEGIGIHHRKGKIAKPIPKINDVQKSLRGRVVHALRKHPTCTIRISCSFDDTSKQVIFLVNENGEVKDIIREYSEEW